MIDIKDMDEHIVTFKSFLEIAAFKEALWIMQLRILAKLAH